MAQNSIDMDDIENRKKKFFDIKNPLVSAPAHLLYHLMSGKHVSRKPGDFEEYLKIRNSIENDFDIKSGLIGKEEFDNLLNDEEFKNRIRAVNYAKALQNIDEEEKKKILKNTRAISQRELENESADQELDNKNFNMHFYRVMTSLMLFGVIDVLDIFGSALDLMGGDFSDSLKEIVGSQEVMGDLSKLYTALKIDEMVGLASSLPILEDLNQFFVDALSSDYLSPITSVGENFLSSQLAVLTLGAVLIANRGYQEYDIYTQAKKLNEKEEKDLKQLKENIKISIKNFQKDPTLIFHKKNRVDMENYRSDIYWDKVRSDNQFCEAFLTKAQNFLEKNISNVDNNIDKLTDKEKQDHQESKECFNKLKEFLEDTSFSSAEKIDKFEKYLELPQNKKIFFDISKFIQEDFFKHDELILEFGKKRSEHYAKKFSHDYIKSSESSTKEESNTKINNAISRVIKENIDDQIPHEKKLNNEQIKLLEDFSKKTLHDKQDFIKNGLNDLNIAVFDKVRIILESDEILRDIRFRSSPKTHLSNASAEKLKIKDINHSTSLGAESRGV